MNWFDLLAYYEEAMALEKERAKRVQPVILMAPKRRGRRG